MRGLILFKRLSIDKKIERILTALNIEQYGTQNSLLLYDPFHQELLSEPENLVANVKVIKPGFIQKRANGSNKILKKAICESVG